MRATLTGAVALVTLLAACTEDPVTEVPTAAERDAARALVDQIQALTAIADMPLDAEMLLAATSSTPITRLLAPAGTRMVMPSLRGAAGSELRGCATVTAYTVSFAECAIVEHVIDGTLTRQGHEIVVYLDDVFLLDAGLHGAASVGGRLTTGPAGLSGALSIGAQWSVDGDDTLIDASVRLDEVTLDHAGCPVGGAMLVTADLVGPDLRETRAIRFGPSCGDISLTR